MFRRALCAILLFAILPAAAVAIPGTPDRVPAATLLVPYFETGIDPAVHPDDTLLAVTNALPGDRWIHVQVWDRDGDAVELARNVQLHGFETWDRALRDLIASSPPAVRAALRVGAFYRGFVTVDAVTEPTPHTPIEEGFTFSADNALVGYAYYTRLAEGSANGLAMVPLEAVDPGIDAYLRDFYPGGHREEIDHDSRICADQLARQVPCTRDVNDLIEHIDFRQLGLPALGGTTRLVVFAWDAFATGAGISVRCDSDPSCASAYPFRVHRADGSLAVDTTLRLDHVVNVVDVALPTSGWASISNLPAGGGDLEVYAFSIDSARPPSGPSRSWDAIFEASIAP